MSHKSQKNKLTTTTTNTKALWKRIFAPVTVYVIAGYCCWGWLNWPVKRRAPKHEKTNVSHPGRTQTAGLQKTWYNCRINASPVGLCWIRKRKGLSRVISSTAMRENITAANKRGEINHIGKKKSWWKTCLCICASLIIPLAAAALVPCSLTSILIFCMIFDTHSCSSAERERERERNVRLNTWFIDRESE